LAQRRCQPGILIDVCPGCGGAWLDEGEAGYFTSRPDELHAALERAFASAWSAGTECPRCGGDLEAMSLGEHRQPVERCVRCAGLWVDATELAHPMIAIPVDPGAPPSLRGAQPIERQEPALRPPVFPGGFFGRALAFARDPVHSVLAAAALGDVVHLPMVHSQMYLVNHPDGVKHVLQDNAHNYSRERAQGTRMLKPMIGEGVLTSDGAVWRTRRRTAQRSFGTEHLAAMDADVKDEALAVLGRWRSTGVFGPVDLYRVALKVAVSTTMRSLFGYRVTREERDQLYQAIMEGQQAAWSNIVFPFVVPRWLPTPLALRKGRRVIAAVNGLATRVLETRRAAPRAPRDYLRGLLEANGDEREIRDAVVTIMTAAPENMAYTFTMALWLIAGHPEVEAALREEIERVLGRRQPVAADLERLTYTASVLKETLRLYPGAYIFDRWTIHEDRVCGYAIPAGSHVLMSPYAMHHRADLWPDPERFDPTRFSEVPPTPRPRFAYFPFGGGAHRCLGEHYALMQLQLLLPLVLQQTRFRRVDDRPINQKGMITLRPRGGVWMDFEPLEDRETSRAPDASSVAPVTS
jgi:cytochrome P450/Zn-finger nucleic acid-binding protein